MSEKGSTTTITIGFDKLIDGIRKDNDDYKESTTRIIEAMEKRYERFEQRCDERFDDIDKRLESLENTFNSWMLKYLPPTISGIVVIGIPTITSILTYLIIHHT